MKLIIALAFSVTALSSQAGDIKSCAPLLKFMSTDDIQYKTCLKPHARIGMTQEQVLNDTEWGYGIVKRNKTVTAFGVSEQWVYAPSSGGGYLYFTNGKLTAIQN